MTHSFPTRRSSDLCTPPANYYHVLRRQMLRPFRKPLVIVTPKSLLRHKAAVSELADFAGDSHFRRILSDPNAPADEIGRASCRERVCQDVSISVVAVSLKKQ